MRATRIPRCLHRVPVAALLAASALSLPAAAQAHAFLIRSDPPAGARLASAPKALVLYFSEPFVSSSAVVALRRGDGGLVPLPAVQVRGATVQEPLPRRLRGIFVVSWRVLADDGHISLGEFAFAVGSSAALPSVESSTGQTSGTQVAASWLFFLGLALALGGLASERVVWRRSARVPQPPVVVGLALAALGAFAELALVAGNERGGGLADGLRPSALADAAGTRPGLLTVVAIGALAAAALGMAAHRRVWALAPLAVAVVATALRGHAGTSGKWWAVAADAVHLAGAALWLGALGHLALVVARSQDRSDALVDGVRRYSRLALPTVLVVLASGIASAFAELRQLGDLVHSSYGQALVAKTALAAVALALAGWARRRAVPRNPSLRSSLLRRLTGGEATALAGVLVAVSLLVNLVPPRSEIASAAPALGPPPLSGPSIRLAALAGQLVVGLAAGERELQFTILPPGDAQATGVELSAEAARAGMPDADLFPRSCGDGCFTIRFALPPGTTTIRANVSARGWQGGTAEFRVPSPLPREDPALLRHVIRAMRRVRVLELVERVSSGPSSAAAPAGYRLSGKAYLATETFGGGAVDIRPIGHAGGLTELAFALPGSNVWYRLWIDRSSRIRREEIVDPGHLIRRTFAYPSTKPAPPRVAVASRIPTGPFTLAREDDDLAVGLAARPDLGGVALTVTVLGGDGNGVSGLALRALVAGRKGRAAVTLVPCGAGCYRGRVARVGRPRLATLTLSRIGRAPARLAYPFPASWPPVSATELARRATTVFYHLRSVVYDERLASSARDVVDTVWTLEAPTSFSYAIRGGSAEIAIGRKRWDRDPGTSWRLSTFGAPTKTPFPFWISPPKQAALLGSAIVRGRPAWVVSFVQPNAPAWFTLWIDKESNRPLELRMVAPAHFMHHVYRDFNSAPPIRPPR